MAKQKRGTPIGKFVYVLVEVNYLVLLFEKWSNQFFFVLPFKLTRKVGSAFFDVTTEGITTLIIVTRLSGKNTEKPKRLFRQQQELKRRHSHLLQ